MELIRLSKPDRTLHGTIALDGSKSISNRALIVLALAGVDPADWLSNLSTSKDTTTLQRLLAQPGDHYDAGDAGTTFRFLTAYLALQPGIQILTGSARMRERPVGGLVQALHRIGADIDFLEKEGYPPLKIKELNPTNTKGRPTIHIQASTSSQFLSALLMIGPYLPDGLELVPEGELVSRPYLEMTMQLMRHFGANADWQGDSILVESGRYQPRPFAVEADWSAASYWYTMAAFADEVDLHLQGLFMDSWQGDSVVAGMMQQFGVHTDFGQSDTPPADIQIIDSIRLKKSGGLPAPSFEWDFIECPDIAQTLAVTCAGLGVRGLFTGLETLFIKETDRVAALKTELAKVGVSFEQLPNKAFFAVEGQAAWSGVPHFATYGDHRMAMSFAPLAFFAPIEIEHPAVVAKSYPAFWEHLAAVGFGRTDVVKL